ENSAPLTWREYYQPYGFSNTGPELGLAARKGNAVPMIPAPRPEQVEAINRLSAEIRDLAERVENVGPRNVTPALRARLDALRKERAEVRSRVPTTMVMQEMTKPRDTFILTRGAYDRPGEKVRPDVPSVLPPLP